MYFSVVYSKMVLIIYYFYSMLHSLRILLSELILMSLISTTLLPASLMAAEPTMNDVSITHSTDIDTSQAIPGIPLSDETSLG